MCGKEPDRKPSSRRATAVLALLAGLCVAAPARAAEGLWDKMLQTFDVKAAPAGPAPAFVERTRPDPDGLGYLPSALPHKVSPLPVKTAAQIQAQKDALDGARERQLTPGIPRPLQPAKGKKPDQARPAPAAAD